jgi:hypothetical protein
MTNVSAVARGLTMLEALKKTAHPIDLKRLQSQQALRWLGLGPTVESDLLLPIEKCSQHHRASLLPGRVTIQNYDRIDPRGLRQNLEALRRAARPLREGLIAEVFQATGIPFGGNERVRILSDLWRDFILNFETSSVEDAGGRRFDGVRVHHDMAERDNPESEQSAILRLGTRPEPQKDSSGLDRNAALPTYTNHKKLEPLKAAIRLAIEKRIFPATTGVSWDQFADEVYLQAHPETPKTNGKISNRKNMAKGFSSKNVMRITKTMRKEDPAFDAKFPDSRHR